jgi:hypothetical protein
LGELLRRSGTGSEAASNEEPTQETPANGEGLLVRIGDRKAGRRRSAAVAASVTPRTTIAAIATATATATTGLTGTSLIDGESASAHVVSVEFLDGTATVFVAHLHETEAAGAAGVAIGDHFRGLHGAVSGEHP